MRHPHVLNTPHACLRRLILAAVGNLVGDVHPGLCRGCVCCRGHHVPHLCSGDYLYRPACITLSLKSSFIRRLTRWLLMFP